MLTPYAASTVASIILLSGCNSGATLPGASAVTRIGLAQAIRHYKVRSARVDGHGRSWMAPDAKKQDLLYISNGGNSTVDVYSFPKVHLEGELQGSPLDAPTGMCVDGKGDVWIVNQDAAYSPPNTPYVIEYAHGGTTPIATLSENSANYYVPADCAVDPTTGNLALSNGWIAKGTATLGIAIYKKAQGKPIHYYTEECMGAPRWLAYDNSGNLLIDDNGGCDEGLFLLFELAKGSHVVKQLSVSGGCCLAPSGVQWYGKGQYFAVADDNNIPAVIYGLKITPSGASGVARTPLNTGYGSYASYPVDFWIQDGKVIVTLQNGQQNNTASFYHYPAGGYPTNTLRGFSTPEGVVVSKASQKALSDGRPGREKSSFTRFQ